jgi:hypothetical protein
MIDMGHDVEDEDEEVTNDDLWRLMQTFPVCSRNVLPRLLVNWCAPCVLN